MREKLIQKKAKREMTVEHEALSPLSWKEQLQQTDAKVLEVKSKQRNGSAKVCTTNQHGKADCEYDHLYCISYIS